MIEYRLNQICIISGLPKWTGINVVHHYLNYKCFCRVAKCAKIILLKSIICLPRKKKVFLLVEKRENVENKLLNS